VDLRQFLTILRVRWRFVVFTILTGVFLTAGLILLTPLTYASRATLFVSPPSTGIVDTYNATFTAQQRAESYANLAVDAEVLGRVAARLGNGTTAHQLADEVTTSVDQNTLLLQIDVQARSPEQAQQIATVMADEVIRLVKELESPTNSDVPAPIVARLANKASYNRQAVAPNIPLNAATGLALSLLAGIAGAVIRDVLDSSVKDNDEVEALTGSAPMATLPFDVEVKDHPLITEELGGALSEAFRVLRTNLQFSNLDASRQMLVVTSAVPNEGKTFIATNLAISMAKGGRSVLLLDADMRKPNVAALLGLENSVGLITVLLGRTTLEQAVQMHSSGVSFLGTGPQPPNPAEVLDTQAMRELFGRLRAAYDVVIVDAPPLLPVADAAILLTEVDGALLVTRHGSTNREQLRQAVARVRAVGGRLVGTILNQAPRRRLTQYGYGYGYDYGYGQSPRDEGRSTRRASGRRARR
jgi:capsular exopolysaccharide synthesis family protein